MQYRELPSDLQSLAIERWQGVYPEHRIEHPIAQLMALSDFAFRLLQQHPQLGWWLLDAEQMQQREVPAPLPEELTTLSEQDCFQLLRQYRQKYWLKVMWLDFVCKNDISDSIRYISKLSECLIDAANCWAFSQTVKQCGAPLDEAGNMLPMLVLGMGKLGGGELNFSSDIDLIFTYPKNSVTSGGRKQYEAQVFYTKVARKLIAALDQVTVDGQVFRVDMRLRPFGESGPLVMSFAAMEDYYQDQGREWERYAMLKARVLGPHTPYSDEFKKLLRPFVYRRYIDFSVIESLRKMKQMIAQEVRRKGLVNNIKLGAGGIREVEFIIQALQMVRGGRDVALQTPSLLAALEQLMHLDILPAETAQLLVRNYLFLRRVEQYLQAFDDQQTQTLPDSGIDIERLNFLLEKDDFAKSLACIDQTMKSVREEFALVIGEQPQEQNPCEESYSFAWLESDFSSFGDDLTDDVSQQWSLRLDEFKTSLRKRQMGTRGRDILDKLMPHLLELLVTKKASFDVFNHVLKVISTVVSRTTYLELLYENQGALKQLISLCGHSRWIAEHIAKYPILLDELLDPAALYKPLPLSAYKDEIRHQFLRIEPDDLELQMEALRQFKQTHQLRIAAADATGVISVTTVSNHLTALAEAIINQAVDLAWQQMKTRYGKPTGATEAEKGFAVIAYGKAGGLELGYDSDLDLVFVHNRDGDSDTDGIKSISSRQFYLKLAQRLMHLFNTKTASGILYELDTRLRPEGNSGLLAINLESYFNYQQTQAWTWEHQALVRARMVLAEPSMQQRFDEIRNSILRQRRDKDKLQQDVSQMREKMRAHLSQDSDQLFDLKQGRGGMTDIEFIAQYLVLSYSHNLNELTRYTDNIRIFEYAEQGGILNEEEKQLLTDAYCLYRDSYHQQSLDQQGRCVAKSERFTLLAQGVKAIFESRLLS
ncbi:bifunctional [glutamate--ammonia ligase]-adenylyl-L-tyrosine phosphorylase/[glutamate--ammonia-ligase] adenylyltransferase [Pseudoalteromonas citrea]|uniref:Bifunctional glutamine synthetase adenylyltransferase/adenylyl-removing enzyme n=1 Tax=Pseudoalteromonas citrea TaxID=43655 RepID=A0A5S3XL52_9GAMM|nr:bifunctional [glutamate--ammonia ligase]-adenylyl-L-tyrosine phosphorylase/[glutamate--ammonia-ligase] adenylyltransferase [Pseudoalteromonas citrea]TMP41558.1 bifunctional [glutamate--ammonia ligase]-adenylyl-L-tyrosine phosphorylase/[glutamate--ammonia-ligase] adenylyltransferase [Pseudoalteromonas citrea]TMP55994.1 bifunctional [glutamate--ammonia ligase]-adenylyl-L-tyrosine phosphorylase/[glutamate--ammonia-ligase] adenylyltransferase [Pseudoalteromonas citrea]